MSVFAEIKSVEPIEVFKRLRQLEQDSSPIIVNAIAGVYKTNEGLPWVLPAVREAERRLLADESQNHEYMPSLNGHEGFSAAAVRLLLGDDTEVIRAGRAFGIHCLSGTGSLSVGAEILSKLMHRKTVLLPKETWDGHLVVFRQAGFTDIRYYRYWYPAEKCIDFTGLLEDLESAPMNAVVVLHTCAHNPTGIDPTQEQWTAIAECCKRRKLFPFMDTAYQGFATGNPDVDAWSVRNFAEQGIELFAAQSFAKTFGLYGERVGNLAIIVSDPAVIPAIKSQTELIMRGTSGGAAAFGAKIVHMILSDEDLKQIWISNLQQMANRLRKARFLLRDNIERLKTPGTWNHITDQIGMFSFLGISEAQVELLRTKHHCYLLQNGRLSLSGVTTANVEYLARAINDVVSSGS